MSKRLKDRIARQAGAIVAAFDTIGFVWLWLAISLVLLGLVLLLNPAKLGSYLWFMSKLAGAASLGYGFDLAFFRDADPHKLDGLEKAMSQTRRATLIAASIIGAGLIG